MSDLNLGKINAEDLSKIPLKELLEFQTKLNKAVELRREQEKQEIYQKITALASESGFSLSELMDQKYAKKSPAVIKYRNPDNKDEGWTGKGKKPKWLVDLLGSGKKLEELAV
ncbi:MAG: H-NS histone family protein [Bacteroidia bacterium]